MELTKFHPLAVLVAMRKLIGYLWLALLPKLEFRSLQCAFMKESHAMHAIFVLGQAAEKSQEWQLPLYVAQLDLKSAFDHLHREAAIRALKLQGCSLHTVAWISQMWKDHSIVMRMGCVKTPRFRTTRGLPQGAPESPIIFTLIVEMVMRGLIMEWDNQRDTGIGFGTDGWWISCLAYADDILLMAHSKDALEKMIRDATCAFAQVGLGIGHSKTNWSCTPPTPNANLQAGTDMVEWVEAFVFVGVELTLQGCPSKAIVHQMAQAQKTRHKWKSLLCCPWLSPRRRVELLSKSVWPSFLWGAACWHPTKAMTNKIGSWGARVTATTAGARRKPLEEIGDWWRRMHRFGWTWMRKCGPNPEEARRLCLHRWAGHVARMPSDSQPAQALRARGLQWWRWAQSNHKDKRTGVHPQHYIQDVEVGVADC